MWYADVIAKSASGGTPIIGDFNARAADGATYTVVEGTNPDGLSNQPIGAGGESRGKIYFAVNGQQPDSIVYNTGGNNNGMVWKG